MDPNEEPSVMIVVPEKKSCAKKSFWHINKEMLPYKIHCFLFMGGFGVIVPYYAAIGLTRFQLTAGNLAAAFTVQEFLGIVMKPGIGCLADYFNRLKATINGLTVLHIILCLFMIFIPSVDIQTNMASHENMTINKQHIHHLCKSFDEIKQLSSRGILINSASNQISECLKSSKKHELEHVVVHCSKENHNTSNYINVCYQILQTSCNISFITKSIDSTSQNLIDVFVIVRSFESAQNSMFICFLPKEEIFLRRNSTSPNLKENCLPVPKSEFMDLQDLFFNSTSTKTSFKCDKSISSDVTGEKREDSLSAQNFKTYQFWIFSFVLICACFCGSGVFTMSDTACYESVQGNHFGRQRLWGSISWGLVAPLAGFLNDYTGSYFAAWCLMVLFCFLQIWNLSKINLAKPDFSQSTLKDLGTVISSMEFLAFELGVFFCGMFAAIIWYYSTWFLLKIGGNELLIGLVQAVQCFSGDVPFMFYSGWIIKKFGHFNIISLALLCQGIRFLLYSHLHNPWWILPIESLHGVTYGLFYAAMTSYAKISSKAGTEATTQSILSSTYEGLGAGTGCLLAGICFDYYGSHTTYFFASFLCVIAMLINLMFTILIKCRRG